VQQPDDGALLAYAAQQSAPPLGWSSANDMPSRHRYPWRAAIQQPDDSAWMAYAAEQSARGSDLAQGGVSTSPIDRGREIPPVRMVIQHPSQRNRWFADSPLEEAGFELPVPPPSFLAAQAEYPATP
jgi:hypothetical protein